MDQLNKTGWPLAMDLLMKSEFSTPDEASSSNSNTQDTEKCWVCGCVANGRHYGVMACFGCKGFFRRSVQGGKNYVCRHDRNCVIDQSDRNCCRACRFEKCLCVGMDPAAIQPDRDKTGRQRNPRKSQYVIPPSRAAHKSASNPPAEQPVGRQVQDPPAHPLNGIENENGGNGVSSTMDKTIMDTLLEIEGICRQMKLDISTPYQSIETAIEKPCTIYSRTMMTFEGQYGPIAPRSLREDVLRLSVLMVDYVNTLRPLADVGVPDKVAVVRQCLSPFLVLVVAFHTAQKEDADTVYLPSGHVLAAQQSLFSSDSDDAKIRTVLEIRTNSIRRNFIDQVVVPMRRAGITVAEFAAVKAIMVLDPYAPGMSRESVDLLTSGREAVQRALFWLVRSHHRQEEATARFAHLLMIITAVTRISSQLVTLLHNLRETETFNDNVLSDLFLFGL